MSSADDAFDSLMDKKALVVPVANPVEPAEGIGDSGGGDPGDLDELDNLDDLGLAGGGAAASNPMRVSALLADEPEYRPPPATENGVYVVPTETDLPPVGGGDQVDAARLQGARIAGADADAGHDREERDADADAEYREAEEVDDANLETGVSGLERARRVRRFAYLPLAGGEEFEAMARDLMTGLAARDPERPSLAVTSAGRGEGKTELAIRLALAMAKRVGARVLLADFDLRRPQAAARLGVSLKYFTLIDVLRGSCLLGEALTVSEEDNLYVLPSRATDREGDEILDNREVAGLFGQLHGAFDFTIIDCGSVRRPEALLLCRHAGSAALAGYCGRSSAAVMREAGKALAEAGADVAGMVLTGA